MSDNTQPPGAAEDTGKRGLWQRLKNPPKCSMLRMIVLGVVGGIAGAMTPFYVRFIKELKISMAEMEKNAINVDEWIGVSAPDFVVTTLASGFALVALARSMRFCSTRSVVPGASSPSNMSWPSAGVSMRSSRCR